MAQFSTLADAVAYIKDIEQRVDALARLLNGASQPGVVPIAFATNWTDYATSVPDATQTECSSYKDLAGVVHVQGVARRVTATWSGAVIIGTLAAAHRPALTHGFGCYSIDSASQKAVWRTTVDSGGVIAIQDFVGSANGGIGSFVYLDAISFHP